jgi:hypothetical protein
MFEKIKNIFLKILVVITFAILVPLMMTGQAGCPTGCETAICGNGICESVKEMRRYSPVHQIVLCREFWVKNKFFLRW